MGIDLNVMNEHRIDAETHAALAGLLDLCFDGAFQGRSYFKQLPHMRVIARDGGAIVGQAGLDVRNINVGGTILKVAGVIDLCVHPDRRRRGLGSGMLGALEGHVSGSGGVDFLILMADDPSLYLSNGYRTLAEADTTWLALHQGRSVGLKHEDLGGVFQVKPVGAAAWPAGPIDMLGYLF